MKQHGAFSWFELVTPDVEAATSFYAKLFGWTTEKVPMEGMTYTVVKVAGEDVGGIMAMPPQAKGAPLTGESMWLSMMSMAPQS